MTRDDIQAGDVITLSNTNKFRIIEVSGFLYFLNINSWYAQSRLDSLCTQDLKPILGKCEIIIIERNNKVIWTRPVEMTISEIEKALKLTPGSLRIKDHD